MFTQNFYTKNQVLFPELDTLTGVDTTQTLQNQVGQLAIGTLTQADLLALNTTPFAVVPAPGSGYAIIVDEVAFKHNYHAAAYATGGDVAVQYDVAGTPIILFDATLATTASNTSTVAQPIIYQLDDSTGTAIGFDLASQDNLGIYFLAAADFTNGNVANTIDYRVKYRVVGI